MIDYPDHLPCLDGAGLAVGVFDRCRYLRRPHGQGGLLHGLRDRVEIIGTVIGQQRSERLRHGGRGHHGHRTVSQTRDLLCRHDYIAVVGQDHHRRRIHPADGLEKFGRGRVHGLATTDDHIGPQAREDLRETVAGGNGDETYRLGRGGVPLQSTGTVRRLSAHVVDVHLGDLSKMRGPTEDGARVIRVNVDLVCLPVADDELRTSLRGDVLLDDRAVGLDPVQQELRAVEVLLVVPIVHGGHAQRPGAGGDVTLPELMSLECGHEALHQDRQSETACVDHAVLLEHGEQVGPATDRVVGGLHHEVQELIQGCLAPDCGPGSGRRVLQDGEHSPLDRLAHRLERHHHAALECRGDGVGGEGCGRAGDLAQPAQHLAEDDA